MISSGEDSVPCARVVHRRPVGGMVAYISKAPGHQHRVMLGARGGVGVGEGNIGPGLYVDLPTLCVRVRSGERHRRGLWSGG